MSKPTTLDNNIAIFLMSIGNILIFIAMFSTYLWCLPVGLLMDLVGVYFYTTNKRKSNQSKTV